MDITLALLKKSAGKDKIMRTVSYSSLLLTGVSRGKMAHNLALFAKQISSARTVSRLFDDLNGWNTTKGYGFGSQERDMITRILTIVSNLGFQLFYPMEHIGWAADRGFLSVVARPWQVASIVCWLVALVANVLNEASVGEPSADRRHAVAVLRSRRRTQLLSLLRNTADLIMAVSFLPARVGLWAGRLPPHKTAIFGTLSSLVGLYTLIEDERRQQTSHKVI